MFHACTHRNRSINHLVFCLACAALSRVPGDVPCAGYEFGDVPQFQRRVRSDYFPICGQQVRCGVMVRGIIRPARHTGNSIYLSLLALESQPRINLDFYTALVASIP